MITVFSCPKAFKGATRVHQFNAVGSWKRLHPAVQVILVGNDEGVAEASRELGVTHIPECERNDYGTPLISSIFGQARAHACHGFLCYANADIILTSRFLDCLRATRKKLQSFLLVGKRWDLDYDRLLDFGAPNWERNFISYTRNHGLKATQWQIDYFAFPATEFRDLPPFAVGRVRWDNWMIWKAREEEAAVVDASDLITAIHQNHDYSHYPGGQKAVWEGPEAEINHELAGGWEHVYSIDDYNYRIRPFAVKLFVRSRDAFSVGPTTKSCWQTLVRAPSFMRNAVMLAIRVEWRSMGSKLIKKLRLLSSIK